ncbi:rRNA methylase [Synechococcus sp. PCC 7502]|uniref:TrmH family RNA methyltransferase n=1 Tax=Synechococcus sp. PCC 7502 TaxID=1173263 RepID=UPI00029FEF9F|nr:RNA methyltransferase [Synechococcus sp. PCC 7502]AFY74881.1 rRNA methylase [Synechococcus sp. PCC 7502]
MLTSTRNPLIKNLRQLGLSTKARRQQQLFLIEGTHALIEAIATDHPLNLICCTEAWRDTHADLYDQCLSVGELQLVSPEVLGAITTTVHPDGVVAVAPICSDQPVTIHNLGLAIESVQDPGNLGAIIRSAVAAGIDGLLVSSDSVDLTHPKILRATAGQWFRCPMQSVGNLESEIKQLQTQGIQAIATLPNAKLTYWDLDFSQPSLILLGNEGNGLSSELINLADEAVQVPLSNGVESLNLAVTAALLIYEAKRQRRSLS